MNGERSGAQTTANCCCWLCKAGDETCIAHQRWGKGKRGAASGDGWREGECGTAREQAGEGMAEETWTDAGAAMKRELLIGDNDWVRRAKGGDGRGSA